MDEREGGKAGWRGDGVTESESKNCGRLAAENHAITVKNIKRFTIQARLHASPVHYSFYVMLNGVKQL